MLLLSDGMDSLSCGLSPKSWLMLLVLCYVRNTCPSTGRTLSRCISMESSKLKYFLMKIYLSHFPDIISSHSTAPIGFMCSKCIHFHSLLVFARTGQTQGEAGEQSKVLRVGVLNSLVLTGPRLVLLL